MDAGLPKHVRYWMASSSKHDCFFDVGPDSGPKERIGAIQILLIGHSEVFRKMLDESPLAETGDISVPDSDPDTFRNFLKCIYGGTDIVVKNLAYEKCLHLLYLCEKYLTLMIKEKISSSILQLHQPLSLENVLKSLSNPSHLASIGKNLTKAISKVIQSDTEKVLNHESFLDLDTDGVVFIVEQENISTKEVNLWKAVLNWAKKKISDSEDPKDVRSYLENILKHIRFCAMDASHFCELVVPSKVLTPVEVFEICNSIGTKNTPELHGLNCEIVNRFKSPAREITFSYEVNIKEFTDALYSPKVKLCDFDWNIKVERKDNTDLLGIFLCSSPSYKTSSWKCSTKCKFEIVNHIGRPYLTKSWPSYHEFTNEYPDWGFKEFSSFEKLLNIGMGYIKNNSIKIVTHVELKS